MSNRKKSGIRILRMIALSFCIGLCIQAQAFVQVYAQTEQPFIVQDAPQPQEIGTVRAEAGIIEVYSGFVDTKGKFWKIDRKSVV